MLHSRVLFALDNQVTYQISRPDKAKAVIIHCANVVRSAALRASARSLAGCRTDRRTDDDTQTGDRQVRTTLGILWLPKQRVKLAPMACAGKASDDYQTSTDKQHRHDLTIFFTIFYWRREEVVEENHGRNTWKKICFFIQFPNFFAQLSTLLHLPRYVIKVYLNLRRQLRKLGVSKQFCLWTMSYKKIGRAIKKT